MRGSEKRLQIPHNMYIQRDSTLSYLVNGEKVLNPERNSIQNLNPRFFGVHSLFVQKLSQQASSRFVVSFQPWKTTSTLHVHVGLRLCQYYSYFYTHLNR